MLLYVNYTYNKKQESHNNVRHSPAVPLIMRGKGSNVQNNTRKGYCHE